MQPEPAAPDETVFLGDLNSMRREDLEAEVKRLRKASKSYCRDATKFRLRARAATEALRVLVTDLERNLPKEGSVNGEPS